MPIIIFITPQNHCTKTIWTFWYTYR